MQQSPADRPKPASSSLDETATAIAGALPAPNLFCSPFCDDDPFAALEAMRDGPWSKSLDSLVRFAQHLSDDSMAVAAGGSLNQAEQYALPEIDEDRVWEERLWVQALLCSYTEWAGVGNEASYKPAVKLFVAAWKPRLGIRPPTADFVDGTLLPLWRARFLRFRSVHDVLGARDTEVSKLKKLICRLAYAQARSSDEAADSNLSAYDSSALSTIPLPLTEDNLSSHLSLLKPVASLITGAGCFNTLPPSIASSDSDSWCSSLDECERPTRPSSPLALHPRLSIYEHRDEISEEQAAVVRDEERRFLTGRHRDYPDALTGILPYRTLCTPLEYALRLETLIASGVVPPSYYPAHSSNLLPLCWDAAHSYKLQQACIIPTRPLLDKMLSIVKKDEAERVDAFRKTGVWGVGQLWVAWLDDDDFFPLALNIVIFVVEPGILIDHLSLEKGEEVSSVYVPSFDGRLCRTKTHAPLPPQIVPRLTPLCYRHPNPFLLVITAAIMLVNNPTRPLPSAFAKDLVLCVEIFVRIFRNPPATLHGGDQHSFLDALVVVAHGYARERPADEEEE